MIARDPSVDALLAKGAPVAIGVSGGKDSQAAALATIAYLDRIGHTGPRLLVHSDLGVVEWDDSLPACRRLAEHLGLELLVLKRAAGDLMDRWEARWESSRRRYALLETVTLVPCWSTPSMRFCTSELKTKLIAAALRRRWRGQLVVNVTGIRRQESAKRALGTIANLGEGMMNWRPLSDWSLQQVLDCIAASGLALHEAYGCFSMSRVSCRFCIMSNEADLTHAAIPEESHALYRRMVALEIASTFALQGSRWLGDVRPALLDAAMQRALHDAKLRAAERRLVEARVTPAMRYVKGWPVRMLTDDEADQLASVRLQISSLFALPATHVTRDAIHARYAELMSEKSRRLAA